MRHNKLKALNYKLSLLLPTIQDIRIQMSEVYDAINFYQFQRLTYCKGFKLALKEFNSLIKKLSIQLAKYAKINAQRKQYRIFIKCTQFSIF